MTRLIVNGILIVGHKATESRHNHTIVREQKSNDVAS